MIPGKNYFPAVDTEESPFENVESGSVWENQRQVIHLLVIVMRSIYLPSHIMRIIASMYYLHCLTVAPDVVSLKAGNEVEDVELEIRLL